MTDLGDETTVDLQTRHWLALEQAQRSVASAKVIECGADAHLVQQAPFGERGACPHKTDERRTQDQRVLRKTRMQLRVENEQSIVRVAARGRRTTHPLGFANVEDLNVRKDRTSLFDGGNLDDGYLENLGCRLNDGLQLQCDVVIL